MQINAVHIVSNRADCLMGGAGIVGQMLQNATKHKINWIDNRNTIKEASVGIIYSRDQWPWLRVTKISHVITEVSEKTAFVYKDYDVLVTVAEHAWKMFKQLRSKVELIENVARPSFIPGPKDNDLTRDVPILIYCGQFGSHKGTNILIQAVENLKCELWLIGDGNIIKPRHENIKFLGIKKEEEIIKYLRSADIFVFPSQNEGMSLALLEAMATGLPCVVTKVPGNIDTCKEAAIYVEYNINSLRAGIIKLIESKQLQKDLSGLSLEIASTRKYDDWSERFTSVIENTILL